MRSLIHMKKLLGATLLTVALTVLILIVSGCGVTSSTNETLGTIPLPEVTTEEIKEGTLFVRCSEPENNAFSVQFVGVVPTNYVDYVGFEACIVYPDGTRGTRKTTKLYTLYPAITNDDGEEVITSKDFGVENGYLFVRALDGIPTDEPDLYYEIMAYYVIGEEKTYTAKQIFSIKGLLEEHILADPKPFEVKEESAMIDVQEWVRFEDKNNTSENACPVYYLGASLPDSHGNLRMFACFAVPTIHNNTVGIRYNFTQTSGDFSGTSTPISRIRTNTLYHRVISEDDELTIEDFGLSEGYLAVVSFSEYVNIVHRRDFTFNLLLYYSRNALETVIASEELDFNSLVKSTVLTNKGSEVKDYDYLITNYLDWFDLSEADGNAIGSGLLRVRLTNAQNEDGFFKYSMQVACAVPTRYADRIAFVYTAYDKNGNVIGTPGREVSATPIYPYLFDNGQDLMLPSHFGIERGYIMSMALNGIEYDSEIAAIKLEAYYRRGNDKTYLASMTVQLDTLKEKIEKVL